jgi:hypothetical protein
MPDLDSAAVTWNREQLARDDILTCSKPARGDDEHCVRLIGYRSISGVRSAQSKDLVRIAHRRELLQRSEQSKQKFVQIEPRWRNNTTWIGYRLNPLVQRMSGATFE